MNMHYPNAISTLNNTTTWSWRYNATKFGASLPTITYNGSTPQLVIPTGIGSSSFLYPTTVLSTLGDGNNYMMIRLFLAFDPIIV
jgi:hypothetical protein